jgi:hypothetical protein
MLFREVIKGARVQLGVVRGKRTSDRKSFYVDVNLCKIVIAVDSMSSFVTISLIIVRLDVMP